MRFQQIRKIVRQAHKLRHVRERAHHWPAGCPPVLRPKIHATQLLTACRSGSIPNPLKETRARAGPAVRDLGSPWNVPRLTKVNPPSNSLDAKNSCFPWSQYHWKSLGQWSREIGSLLIGARQDVQYFQG